MMKKTLLAATAALCIAAAPAAHAQLVVVDPTNLVENILTAAHTLEQINNQVRQLQNEAQMLVNEARHLTSLDYNALSQLQASLAASDQWIQQAQGLAFDLSQMQTTFARLYPTGYGASTSGSQMSIDARQRWQNALEAVRTATQMQSQAVQNAASDEQTLADLVNQSQSSVGALQAAQSTNQLLALQVRQAMQAQQLQLTQDRATALEQARQVATQERAAEVRRRFQGTGTPYTPYAVSFYGN